MLGCTTGDDLHPANLSPTPAECTDYQSDCRKGNVLIDTAVIEQAITKTKVNDPFIDSNIIDDCEAIYNLGYFYDAYAYFEPADNGIRVIFEVVENPVVSDVVFEGAQVVPINEFKRNMKVKPGEVFNHNLLLEDLEEFALWATEQHGKPLRPISLDLSETGVITIEVAQAKISDIVLEGNEKTKDHVIMRELTFGPGDYLDFSQLYKDLNKVLMLGFFDEINYSIEETENDDEVNLVIELKEVKTGSADFGAGYSSKNGLFGYVDISDSNFLGNGQRANIFFEIGKGTRSYRLGFYEPYLLKDGTSFGFNIYNEHDSIEKAYADVEEKITGTEHVLGGDLSIGRPLGEYTRGSLTLRAESHSFSGDIDQREEPFKLLTIGGNINTNTTNHPFKPSQGYISRFGFETGFTINAQVSTYSKLTLEHSRYYELLGDDLVLAVRGSGGRALSGTLPDSEMFRIGGGETLRGYNYGEEGLVGDKVLLFNTEVRFPIWDFISGVAFVDIGKAWKPNQHINLMDLLESNGFGVGVRIDTPFGLLRLDYGWGLNEESKREGQFYFGLGHTF